MDHSREIPARNVYARTAILALTAGLRSQLPLALLSAAAPREDGAGEMRSPFRLLRSRSVRFGLATAAIGELIADKTPFVPDRIDPGPLAGRLLIGGLSGALFARGHGRSASAGFALGVTSAGAGAYAGYHARVTLDRQTGVPDPVWALAEDLVAYRLARFALHP